jgi:hypothetical protein
MSLLASRSRNELDAVAGEIAARAGLQKADTILFGLDVGVLNVL